jgi:hypothetical protein
MGKFIITEEEKSRILGMHKLATSNRYLTEGAAPYSWAHRSYPVTSVDVTNAPEDKKEFLQNIKNVDVSDISEPSDNMIYFSILGDDEMFHATYSQGKITVEDWDRSSYKDIIFNIPELSSILEKIQKENENK